MNLLHVDFKLYVLQNISKETHNLKYVSKWTCDIYDNYIKCFNGAEKYFGTINADLLSLKYYIETLWAPTRGRGLWEGKQTSSWDLLVGTPCPNATILLPRSSFNKTGVYKNIRTQEQRILMLAFYLKTWGWGQPCKSSYDIMV